MEFLPLKKKLKNNRQIKVSKKGTKATKTGKVKNALGKKILKKEKKAEKSISEKVNEIKEISPGQNEKINYQKNRLFVFMKKKIVNETMVKELHPDIISIRFPRKKSSRWCWAVFESEIKAQAALSKLKSRGDVIVRESIAKGKNSLSKKKLNEIKSKKEIKKMLKQSWT